MSEQFAMRTHGGPWAGTRLLDSSVSAWPLPEIVPDPEGRGEYHKTAESQLEKEIPGMVRGAQYEWHPFSEEWA